MSSFTEKKVIVVDDMRSTRVLVEKALIKFGFVKENIIQAENGKIACDYLSKHKFDLIISDLNMNEMDGAELFIFCKENAEFKGIQFFMLSSDTDRARVSTLFTMGLKHFISKPLNESDLLKRINEIF